jgi:hypothetical protein
MGNGIRLDRGNNNVIERRCFDNGLYQDLFDLTTTL